MNAPALLTIDDGPSARFAEKLEFLTRRRVPAVLFCWGEKISGNEAVLVDALRQGHILANHSWTHRRFSGLTLSEARREVLETEQALDGIHARAGLVWNRKYFRFPYLDAGGSTDQAEGFQALLRGAGYQPLPGQHGRIDSGCTFDQKEYHYGVTGAPDGLDREEAILARIRSGSPAPGDCILVHDHEATHELFFRCVERYLELGLTFAVP